jgi:hypothetical protein
VGVEISRAEAGRVQASLAKTASSRVLGRRGFRHSHCSSSGITTFIEELTMQRFGNAATRHNTADLQDNDLHVRIRAEFSEMPGLKLTLPQASRLFNIEPALCAHALDRLVSAGCLSLAGGSFVRAGGGRHSA